MLVSLYIIQNKIICIQADKPPCNCEYTMRLSIEHNVNIVSEHQPGCVPYNQIGLPFGVEGKTSFCVCLCQIGFISENQTLIKQVCQLVLRGEGGRKFSKQTFARAQTFRINPTFNFHHVFRTPLFPHNALQSAVIRLL